MRKLKQLTLFLTVVALFASCSKDDDDNSNNGDEFLTAKIEGADYAAAQSPAVIVGAQSTNGVLAVQGGDNNGNTITITISSYAGVGTYTTGDNLSNTNGLQYLQISPSLSTWASNLATAAVGNLKAGSIEITSDDGTTVEGTFSFEGYNASDMTKKMVTQGKFKALFD